MCRYMQALSITGETVNFGNTQVEPHADGSCDMHLHAICVALNLHDHASLSQSQNATIGGICLGIGVCCLIPCYIFAYLAYMMHKRSQQGGMDQAPAGNYGNNDTGTWTLN